MITVKVVLQSSGKPVSGKRVSLSFDGLLGGSSGNQRTDSQGEAHFNNDPANGKVFVDGKDSFQGRLAGRIIVYI